MTKYTYLFFVTLITSVFTFSAAVNAQQHNQTALPQKPYYSTFQEQLFLTYFLLDPEASKNKSLKNTYFMITRCQDFQRYEKDDLMMQKLQEEAMSDITKFADLSVDKYEIVSPVVLMDYDEMSQSFPVNERDRFSKVNLLRLDDKLAPEIRKDTEQEDQNPCVSNKLKQFGLLSIPFRVRLSNPLDFERIKSTPQQARVLTDIFIAQKNSKRQVYLRAGISIQSALQDIQRGKIAGYLFEGKVDFAEVYLDRELTQLLMNVDLEDQ
jgi:hypothetical protein